MVRILLLIGLLIGLGAPSSLKAQKETYRKKYDLDFMRLGKSPDTWSHADLVALALFAYHPHDSVRRVYSRSTYRIPINYHVWQGVRLPRTPKASLSVSAQLHFPSADSVLMVTHRLSSRGASLQVDTIAWRRELGQVDSCVKSQVLRLDLADSTTTDIQILLMAYLPRVEAYDSRGKEVRHATGTLYGVDLKVDNQSIAEEVVSSSAVPAKLEANHPILPIGTRERWDFSKLKFIGKHRLLALGETMHFNPAIQEAVQELGLYLVREKRTALILKEWSISHSLMFDRYINDDRYELDTTLMDPLVLAELKAFRAERMRQGRPIHYFGFDSYSTSSRVLGEEICSFLFSLPSWEQNLAVCRLVNKLSSTPSLDGAIEVIRAQRGELLEVLREAELAIIEHILKQNAQIPQEGFVRSYARDWHMAENVRFLINLFSPDKRRPILLLAHLGHLGLRPTMKFIASKPCGAYLKDWYGKDLYNLAVLTEGGETKVDKGLQGMSYESVPMMPDGTMEFALQKRSSTPFFMPIPQSWNSPQLGRFIGRWFIEDEPPFAYNLYEQADGLFFLPGRTITSQERSSIGDMYLRMQMLDRTREQYVSNVERVREILGL